MKPVHKKLSLMTPAWVALVCGLGCAELLAAVTCTFTNGALTFPSSYDASASAPTDGVGSVNLSCVNMGSSGTSGETIILKIGPGAHGSVSERKMASGSSYLRYGIYSDAGRSQNWGDGFDAPTRQTGPLTANQTTSLQYTLYGRIPAQQNVPAGTYSDSLLLTFSP